jgi:hypothetical protein
MLAAADDKKRREDALAHQKKMHRMAMKRQAQAKAQHGQSQAWQAHAQPPQAVHQATSDQAVITRASAVPDEDSDDDGLMLEFDAGERASRFSWEGMLRRPSGSSGSLPTIAGVDSQTQGRVAASCFFGASDAEERQRLQSCIGGVVSGTTSSSTPGGGQDA